MAAAVLRRMARKAGEAAAEAPRRALADALRRAGEEGLGILIEAGAVAEARALPLEIAERLPETPFLALLEGPGGGAGLFALDASALAAVIEVQTTGRVAPAPPPPRRPTRTDAAIVADLVDRVLAELEAELIAGPEAARWASGWRYQMHLPDPRPLPVVLEDVGHRLFEADLVLAGGPRRGRVLLALPAVGRAAVPPPADAAVAARLIDEADAWSEALEAAVGAAEARLDAVLAVLRLPLAAVTALAPGDRIVLPMAALGSVRLVGPGGAAVATGRLGQAGGCRAVRLAAPDEPGLPDRVRPELLPAARSVQDAAAPAGGAGAAPG
jgi:flagellar motor switch protein FliM